ncbi:MAG: hypothetical protein FP816_13805 [Desulfobacteraceae bacterium]|nr:hypothetical protein [Desulfobacteraceae bacterium]
MGAGTLIVTYFIGKKVYHPIVGIMAAAFLAVCPLSNWIGIRILNDVPVVFFIYLSICMLLYDKKAAFYIFGICAVLTKYSAFPVLFLPFFMGLSPRTWGLSYLGIIISLYAMVTLKSFYHLSGGPLEYFYHYFQLPTFTKWPGKPNFFWAILTCVLLELVFSRPLRKKNFPPFFIGF